MVKGAVTCHLVGLFQGHLVPDFTDECMGLTVQSSGVAADEQEMADLDVRNVMGSGCRRCRKFQSKRRNFLSISMDVLLVIEWIAYHCTAAILGYGGKNDNSFSYRFLLRQIHFQDSPKADIYL